MNISKQKVLTDNNLLSLRGGAEDLSCYHCVCNGSPGEWYAKRESLEAAEADGATNCESGSADCDWTMMSMCAG